MNHNLSQPFIIRCPAFCDLVRPRQDVERKRNRSSFSLFSVLRLSARASPYHPIRSRQHVRRDNQTDLLSGFEVDYQFELSGLLDGDVCRLSAF